MNRLDDLERRISVLEQALGVGPNTLTGPYVPYFDTRKMCSCAPGSVCLNAACPYRSDVTCGVAQTTAPVG